MNIYIVANDYIMNANNFAYELAESLRIYDHNVIINRTMIWQDEVFTQDVVYFQWPDWIFLQPPSEDDKKRLLKRLEDLRAQGILVVSQCHNLYPHQAKNKIETELYNVVYSNVDAIIHMGRYSRGVLQQKYPGIKHYIVPHHIYEKTFRFNRNQQDCRRELKLGQNRIIVLSFGKFRNDAERKLILKLRKQLSSECIFVTPGFYREKCFQRNVCKALKVWTKTIIYKLGGIRFDRKYISDVMAEKYFCAADIVFIQRLDILNSGNLPMAYSAGKVVVGPNVGNVGEILRETANPSFDPNDFSTIIDAVRQGVELSYSDTGIRNREYAENNWSLKMTGMKLTKVLEELRK